MTHKFTLNDPISLDSLATIQFYVGTHKLVVVGGIANQLYTYSSNPELMRPTHDLDFITGSRLTAQEFRADIGRFFAESLQRYGAEVRIGNHVYEVKLEDSDHTPFFVHSYKWSERNFERNKRRVERQVSNALKTSVPNRDGQVYVVRPEEIIADKLTRLKEKEASGKISNEDEAYYKMKQQDWTSPAILVGVPSLETLIQKKTMLPAFYDSGIERFKEAADEYVRDKDLYDIALLIRLFTTGQIPFDNGYFNRIILGRE